MKNNKKSSLHFISEVAGNKKIYIIVLLLVQMLLGVSSVAYAFLLRSLIDGAVVHDKAAMIKGIILFAGLVIAQIALNAVVRFVEELAKASYENAFKHRLFRELLTRDYAKVTAIHSGEWMNRLTSDTTVVAQGLATIVPGVVGMITKMSGALLMLLVLEPGFGFILIPGGILLVILTYAFRKSLKKLHKKMQEKDGRVRIFLQEHLVSLIVLKVFGKEDDCIMLADKKMDEHKRARMKKNHFSNICNIGFGGAMNGAYVLGAIYSAFGIYNKTMSYGTLMAILQLIGQIQGPFANITGYLPRYYAMLASAERLMEVEDYDISQNESAMTVQMAKEIYEKRLSFILFENVTFSYRNNQKNGSNLYVLHNMNFEVKKGDYVAITGTSGCGKSTMLKILMGLYKPQSGKVGAALNDGEFMDMQKLRRLFAYVPQGNYLMSGSIKDVITFGNETCNSIENAVKLACADFIYDLPDGINTILGEKGTGLSEGQMQRIAIARALYADVPVLILDEATSSLDVATEEKLLCNLKKLTDKTVFIVTHRPKALSICNKKLELAQNGE